MTFTSLISKFVWAVSVFVAGVLALIVIAIAALTFALWYFEGKDHGPPDPIELISVGHGYAIGIQAKPLHPYLAEFSRKIFIYNSYPDATNGLSVLDIPTNSGGHVRIGLFVSVSDQTRHSLLLLQQHTITRVDLHNLSTTEHFARGSVTIKDDDILPTTGYKFIGLISGFAYPIRFIPCSIWPYLSEYEMREIFSRKTWMLSLCERYG